VASKSKIKGNAYERELVEYFKSRGFESERSRGSDGRSIGEAEDVDGFFMYKGKRVKFQAKRRKSVPKWLDLGNCDIVVTRADRGTTTVLIDLDKFMDFIGGTEKIDPTLLRNILRGEE
jgi:Holliday junction resolvase